MILVFIVLNLFFLLNFDRIKLFRLINDKPDGKRKIHLKPIPLAGGIILMINISIYFILILINPSFFTNEIFFNNDLQLFIFMITSILIFLIGIFDDEYNLSPNLKILLLSSVIFFILYFDNDLVIRDIRISFLDNTVGTKNLGILFSLFCILVFLNAFNMFDGINLQSSIFSFSLIIFFIYINFLVDINFLILQSLLLFLYLNFKNKSFLGDGGCYLLSFMLGSYSIVSYNNSIINNCDVIFILMILPGFDMLRLFVVRIINKTSPFKPDRNHFHHLLLKNLGYLKTISLISSLIFLNIVLIIFSIDTRIIFLLFIIYYFFLILRFRN